MKVRETGSPSHRNDGKGLVLPISQQIARMAQSAQKVRVNHLFRTKIISVKPREAVRFQVRPEVIEHRYLTLRPIPLCVQQDDRYSASHSCLSIRERGRSTMRTIPYICCITFAFVVALCMPVLSFAQVSITVTIVPPELP